MCVYGIDEFEKSFNGPFVNLKYNAYANSDKYKPIPNSFSNIVSK